MNTKYFVLHLLPSRSDFAFTMTDEERKIMELHVEYWTEKMNEGKVVVFGPVFDPEGPYGLGIIKAESEQEVIAFIENDPAGKINKYEYFSMNAIVPGSQTNKIET